MRMVANADAIIIDRALADHPVTAAWDDAIPRIVVPAGEAAKEWSILHEILTECTRLDLTRTSRILVVGGGATTDVGALAASIYMRGVAVELVPTTLLAMVDAAIGGKTGIDFAGYKNLVGSFYPADTVTIDTRFLETLEDRQYRSGLAEVIKAAMLADRELFRLLEERYAAVLDRDPDTVAEMISHAVRVKTAIVERDFTESGVRAHLNLGHTFGHALESVLGLGTVTHGEAVAWGIGRALMLGAHLGVCDRSWVKRATGLLRRYGYPLAYDGIDPVALIDAMRKDKKRTRESLVFVVQRAAHDTFVCDVEDRDVREILARDR
jgi:3-dehydroquinate synthase